MVPTLSVPGFSRAALMKSPSVLNEDSALVANTRSKVPSAEIVAKSLTGSNGNALYKATLIAVPLVRSASVCPSGAAVVTDLPAEMPPGPGELGGECGGCGDSG